MPDALDAPLSLDLFFEGWELFREPALAGAIAGALLGLLGVYVVLRRVVFLSAAVSQAAGLGVALSFYAALHLGVAVSPLVGAAVLTGLAVLPFVGGGTDARRESLLGVIWLLGSAGTLAVGTRIVAEVTDIQDILFGTAVAVAPEDFARLWQVALALGLLHLWWWRGFAAASFSRDAARVQGLPVRLLDVVLFATLALAVSLTTRTLGALPAFAFSVLPAVAALAVARSVPQALVLATGLGALTGFGGYLLSFRYSLPVGPAQALLGVALVAALHGPVRAARGVRRLRARFAATT
ncbi:MAG: metal ABC transporter permease [Myxococcales bacterium]|nr:metal ABC transporter permease [Myxococcales bacterium]MCB9546152.1 metal ABC transporter permease [Myxococcales bacterium]